MRCDKCEREFPSKYHFMAEGACNECWQKMDVAERAAALKRAAKVRELTTTTFTIDGYRVVRSLGVVRGVTVRSRSVFGTLGAALQTIVGGNISLFTELCEKTRPDAFEMMVEHAEQVGANAVVGIRYDATEVMDGVTEVICYGTAVVVAPEGSAALPVR